MTIHTQENEFISAFDPKERAHATNSPKRIQVLAAIANDASSHTQPRSISRRTILVSPNTPAPPCGGGRGKSQIEGVAHCDALNLWFTPATICGFESDGSTLAVALTKLYITRRRLIVHCNTTNTQLLRERGTPMIHTKEFSFDPTHNEHIPPPRTIIIIQLEQKL